jgi:hypothetical protein
MKRISIKIWLPIIVILLIAVSLAIYFNWPKEEKLLEITIPKKETPEISANWKTYRNKEYGFEIKYPDDWEVVKEIEEEETNPVWHIAGVFPSPEEVPTKKFTLLLEPKICPNLRDKGSELCDLFFFINIDIYPEASIDSTEEYRKRIITAECGPWMCYEIREDSITDLILGNLPAFRYNSGYWGQWHKYNLVYNKKLYVITSLSDFRPEKGGELFLDFFDYEYVYVPFVRQVLSTFQFIKNFGD